MAVKPMTPATIRRLMEAPDQGAEAQEQLAEAYARGRETGALLTELVLMLSRNERIALGALRRLDELGALR